MHPTSIVNLFLNTWKVTINDEIFARVIEKVICINMDVIIVKFIILTRGNRYYQFILKIKQKEH